MFPYQWMFLLLGVTTILIGSTLWWILPDTPAHASFLTERERVIAIERLQGNMTGIKNRHHKKEQVIEALTDVRIWLLVLCWFLHNLTGPLQSTFAGLVIKGFGFNTTDAILLNIPIAVCYAIGMLFAGTFLSTRWGHNRRIAVLLTSMVFGISGTLVVKLIPGTQPIKLLGVYLVTFTSAASSVMYMLLAANVAGYTKKVVAGALFFAAFSLSQIVAPQAFLTSQAPAYPTGINMTLGAFCGIAGVSSLLWFLYWRENRRRIALGEAEENREGNADGTVDDLILAFSDLTDKQNYKFLYKY